MNGKRIMALLLVLIVAITAMPMQARAEEVYTVKLNAGEGSGDDVVYLSNEGTVADSWHDASNCQFYRCENNGMGFFLKDDYCPDSFTAPDGYIFDGWEGKAAQYNDNISPTTTFTAKWREDTTASLGPIDGIPKTTAGEDFYLDGMKWHVIGEDENRWLAISSGLLGATDSLLPPWGDAMAYCSSVYDGFSGCEKASLLKVTKTDEKYQYGSAEYDGGEYASSLNKTSVFLLSMPEANWYFADDDARVCNEGSGWWLRSRKEDGVTAGTVNDYGGLVEYPVDSDRTYGCRPAFVLNLSSVLFPSAAEGGKSTAAAGSGFGNFQDGGTGAKKLTLLDSGRSGFSANIGGGSTTTAVPGGTVEIKYSGAGTGSNEYVSAMLCNSEGTVIGYVSVAADSDGEDTWSLTLPSDLTDGGTYTLKVFSEQQNEDKQTDYASTPVEISLTVGSAAPETVATPTFSPVAGTYDSLQSVTISCSTSGADIYYTTNGTTPTDSSSKYTGPISVSETTTIKAIAVKSGMTNSSVATATYTIEPQIPTKYAVTVTNGSGSGDYAEGESVTITADVPESGKQFKEWTGADDLTFTNGGKTDSTATFTMPANAVTLTATYEDASRPTPPGPAPHEHSYTSEVTTKPTCTEKGIRTYTCSCGDSYTEEIPALGHDYTSVITTQPTIFTEGVITYTCTRCGHSYTERVPKVDDGENKSDFIKDVTDDNGNTKAEVGTKTNEDGSTETTVTIGGKEVEKIATDANGNETVETSIWIGGLSNSYPYTGSAIKPSFHVYDGTKKLSSGNDYSVSFKNNKNAGATATITVTFKGNYKGTSDVKLHFDIISHAPEAKDKKHSLSKATVKLSKKKYDYTGKEVIPAAGSYTMKLNGKILKEGEDFLVSVVDNVNIGTAKIVFYAKEGNTEGYGGTKIATFRITGKRELKQGDGFTYSYFASVPYARGGAKPAVIVKDGDDTLKAGTDYTVRYSKNTKVTNGATAVITIKGKGNYKGSIKKYFTITKQDISKLAGNIITADKAESKKGYKKPTVTITDLDGKKLKAGTDFAIVSDSYSGPDKNGVVTATISGKGNYSGTASITYRYIKGTQQLSKLKAMKSLASKTYTGREVRLTNSDLTGILYTGSKSSPVYLIPGTDFKVVSYTNNTKTGTAKVTIQGIGAYGGTRTLSFKIIAKKGDIKGSLVGGEWQ